MLPPRQRRAAAKPLRACSLCILGFITAIIAACGGSGGNGSGGGGGGGGASSSTPNNVSMSVSTTSVSESVSVGQSAPSTTVVASFAGLTSGEEVYLFARPSSRSVATLSASGNQGYADLTIQFAAASLLGAGVYSETIELEGCYDQACTRQVTYSPQTVSVQYTVVGGAIQLDSLTPSSAGAGGAAFVLTANGAAFTPTTVLAWNGVAQPTQYVSATQVRTEVSEAQIASTGTAVVTAMDPSTGQSTALTFTVSTPQLGLSRILPSSVTVGSIGFTLTAFGDDFTASSQILFNGVALPTTYVAGNTLRASIPAADVATVGSAAITVQDPTSGFGATEAQTLTVFQPSVDAVTYQITPEHSGGVNFSSVSLPASSLWSADLGGNPSYALIADGNVYVTASLPNQNAELVALDQSSGAIAWGPVALDGNASAAYDNGKLFVLVSPLIGASTMVAYDAQTGSELWSATLTGQYSFTGAVTARNGLVYFEGAGNAGTLYALNETDGTASWTAALPDGSYSTTAVTPDGVYATSDCQTYNFAPSTGGLLWKASSNCLGSGGGPVSANQLIYSPVSSTNFDGSIYSAATGAAEGTLTADTSPAFLATEGFFLQGGTLRGVDQTDGSTLWSFAGDGQLVGAPIAVSSYVFIGSNSGNLYGLDASTGQQVWEMTLPAPVAATGYSTQYTGLSAGDGLLVVPTGTRITAYLLSAHP